MAIALLLAARVLREGVYSLKDLLIDDEDHGEHE
jgi:hypothetical protein